MTKPQHGWHVAEHFDATGMCLSEVKPVIERIQGEYEAQGHRVKVVARSIIEIMVATDA
jgi:hypothetical protein